MDRFLFPAAVYTEWAASESGGSGRRGVSLVSDGELERVNDVVRRLGERANANGIESLSAPERVAVLAPWAVGTIRSGGFRSFYQSATNTLEVADALDELGFPEAAAACRIAHAAVPMGALAGGRQACREWVESVDESEWEARFDELDTALCEVSDRLCPSLAAFIERHDLRTGA